MRRLLVLGLASLLTLDLRAEEPILDTNYHSRANSKEQTTQTPIPPTKIGQPKKTDYDPEFFITKDGEVKFYDVLYPVLVARRAEEIEVGEKIPKDSTIKDASLNYRSFMIEEGFKYDGEKECWIRPSNLGTNLSPRFVEELTKIVTNVEHLVHYNFPTPERINRAREALRKRYK